MKQNDFTRINTKRQQYLDISDIYGKLNNCNLPKFSKMSQIV